jgi:haloalkane dehalogenase
VPNSLGVRKVPGAKLFFPEELPEVIVEEARFVWSL